MINPLVLAWNFKPEVCAFGSFDCDDPVGVPSCQMLHGHWTTAAVVNVHENGPLTALVGGGVYAYGSSNTFPTNVWNNSNYWVDVVYSS